VEPENKRLSKIRSILFAVYHVWAFSYGDCKMSTVKEIQKIVAEHFKIPLSELLGQRRDPEFSHPRMVAMYLCRAYLKLSFPAIGRHFGRDHTTVMHAVTRVLEHKKFKEDMKELNKKFGG
jgi:chromosomal replication initiator protein